MYDVLVRDSGSWLRTARELLVIVDDLAAASQARWAQLPSRPAESEALVTALFRSGHVQLMLSGYAIENLAKAKLAASLPRPDFDAPNGTLPQLLHSHDLPSLLKNISFPFSPAEETLLNEVRRSIEWEARYPIPVKHQGLSRPYPVEINLTLVRQLIERLTAFVGGYPPPIPRPVGA